MRQKYYQLVGLLFPDLTLDQNKVFKLIVKSQRRAGTDHHLSLSTRSWLRAVVICLWHSYRRQLYLKDRSNFVPWSF